MVGLGGESPNKTAGDQSSRSIRTNRPSNHRGAPIQDALYRMAGQMQLRVEEKKRQNEAKEKEMVAEKIAKSKNSTSIQHTNAKLLRQIDQVIENMKEQEPDWTEDKLVQFDQAGSILATLGFLPENVTPENADYALFEEFWALLDGPQNEGVDIRNLRAALQIIKGVQLKDREAEFEIEGEVKGLKKVMAITDEGVLLFRPGGQSKFANKFRLFFINKLQQESD